MRSVDIAQLLPDVIRRTRGQGGSLDHLLGAMETMHDGTEEMLVDFDRYIDPHRCPAAFVPYLADWVGLGWLLGDDSTEFPTGDGPLRDLVATAQQLATQRGTADGLRQMLVTATACDSIDVSVAAQPAFHIVVRCPETIRAYHGLISVIIKHEKPAFVTAALSFGSDDPTPLAPPMGAPNLERSGEEPHA